MSYNLPNDFVSRLGIDAARVFVNGENLILFTDKVGTDPTQNFNGTTQNRFPPARIFTMGVNFNF